MQVHRRHHEAAAEIGALTYVVRPDYSGRALPGDPRVVAALKRTFAELEELQREHGLILDTRHAAICGTLHDSLKEPHDEPAHVHLHDDRGPDDAGDPHLPLGRGIIDAGEVVRRARQSGARVILLLLGETAIAESVAYLERRGIVSPV
ncbi:MAG: TIM barrel protein [Actinobacteria bacterium]|nr:TIM barrel protein [Actinomycetota bacterium]